MNRYKALCILFALAAVCFLAGAVNHLLNTGEGVLSSLFLALGCGCFSVSFYNRK